jgi:hypothetical protein
MTWTAAFMPTAAARNKNPIRMIVRGLKLSMTRSGPISPHKYGEGTDSAFYGGLYSSYGVLEIDGTPSPPLPRVVRPHHREKARRSAL